MHITPILYPRNNTDPLVAKTLAKYPDFAERFWRFTGNNMYDVNRQDMTALDGMVFLNKISSNSHHYYE